MPQSNNHENVSLPLAGKRILIVEDEYFIADEYRLVLEKWGAVVVGPFGTLTEAKSAIDRGGFDCALLDLNLRGESAEDLADCLVEGGTPFAIATGYGSPAVPTRFHAVPRLEKPFEPRALFGLLERIPRARADAGYITPSSHRMRIRTNRPPSPIYMCFLPYFVCLLKRKSGPCRSRRFAIVT